MKHYNVDFIGGDFHMSAFSTVGDVFADPEFSAPGNSFLWGLGAFGGLESRAHRVFSSCRSAHMSGVWIHMAVASSVMRIWRLVPVTPLLTYLFFFICALPISRAPTASPAARGAWIAKQPSMNDIATTKTHMTCWYRPHGRTTSVVFLATHRSGLRAFF